MKTVNLLLVLLMSCLCLGPSATPQAPKALLLFGGKDHKDFLGCLNCMNTSQASVCNELGKYGSALNSDSIWNGLGTYGSSLSEYSPWNSFTDKAPIIVDRDGKSYGYFSVNAFHHDRTRIKWLVAVLDFYDDKGDLDETKEKLCAD
ncbi:MAG: hypothetical protein WCE52_03345 [Candidatus Acidiferrum sp.]